LPRTEFNLSKDELVIKLCAEVEGLKAHVSTIEDKLEKNALAPLTTTQVEHKLLEGRVVILEHGYSDQNAVHKAMQRQSNLIYAALTLLLAVMLVLVEFNHV
jgi:hypothetical protein